MKQPISPAIISQRGYMLRYDNIKPGKYIVDIENECLLCFDGSDYNTELRPYRGDGKIPIYDIYGQKKSMPINPLINSVKKYLKENERCINRELKQAIKERKKCKK